MKRPVGWLYLNPLGRRISTDVAMVSEGARLRIGRFGVLNAIEADHFHNITF
jgi:hypothetical protein